MKLKITNIILSLIMLMTLAAPAMAKTGITGAAFGENSGLFHMDYTTAINPFDPCDFDAQNPLNPNCTDSGVLYDNYHLGIRNEFYVSPVNQYYAPGDPAFTAQIADIGDASGCGNLIADACLLSGFIWSDSIGWIILDGQQIQNVVGAGDFPSANFAHVTYDGVFGGYAWSEYTGWIKLSSDGFDEENAQDQNNWGIYINLIQPEAAPLESGDCSGLDQGGCEAIANVCEWDGADCNPVPFYHGRPVHGYAWSEHLGWIQFDQEDFNPGVYTAWVPDTTPPEITPFSEVWFVNDSTIGTITWSHFAEDPESGIDLSETELTISSPAGSTDFSACTASSVVNDLEGHVLHINMLNAGELSAVSAGFCMYEITGTVTNGAGLTTNIAAPIIFYVRAGEMDLDMTTVERTDALVGQGGSVLADGSEYVEYTFTPRDIIGNPIVPVKVDPYSVTLDGNNNVVEAGVDDWARNTDLNYQFLGDSYYFDSIEPTLQTHIVLPFVIADEGVATSPLIYDQTYIGVTTPSLVDYSYDDPLLNQYPVQVAAFAPTSCGASCDNQTFTMETIQFTVDDAEYITINISGIDEVVQLASYPYELDDTAEIGGGNPIGSESAYLFTPALTVSTGTVDQEPLIVGVPVEATFALINESSSDTINGIAVDNHLTFEDTGAQAVLDFRNIDSGNVTPDPYFGRTDPWEFGIGSPRYLIYGDQFAFAPDNSLFYSASKNYHPVDYYFEGNQNTSGVLDANGVYEVDGFWDLPVPIDYDEDLPEDWPATAVTPYTYIDRADPLAFSALTSGLSENITLNFIPMQWIGEGLTGDVTFNLDNYLAYRMEDAPFGNDTIYAIYEPARTIDGIGVKSIGVEATGVVTGEQVYETIGGRDLEAISTTGTAELRKQIRTNVASLSRNLSPCGANGTLSNLSLVSGGCIKVDDANDTVVTVYEGGVGDLLTIDLGASNPVPDYGYTVIVTGGADVLISDNIVYNSSASSFGIIALADENGEGGNVFIGPDSTNIVGLLYAEGSMISSPDGIHVYYGTNALDANELKNQLYWQGSIVSKNTIGGAPNRVFPENVYCFASDNASCAQIYDMDYIRRFTVNTYQPLGGGYSADNILFSGGGSCIAGDPPVCSLGTLPTTIVLDGNSLIDMTASDIDPFYVEKSTRTAPPGFTVTGGFEQAVEIR